MESPEAAQLLRNYLRVRGEYTTPAGRGGLIRELPPRARRIRGRRTCTSKCFGTTSACAENTWLLGLVISAHGNYLRVRGEYTASRVCQISTGELPPRARRIRVKPCQCDAEHGTTSACAENTKI